jgi:hypothetical protein
MRHRIAAFAMVAVFVAGCAGSPPKDVTHEGVIIGFNEASFSESLKSSKAYGTADAIFIRLRSSAEKRFVVTQLSTVKLQRASADEEVLVHIASLNAVVPAYDSYDLFHPSVNQFNCTYVDDAGKLPKDQYHPCGSGSALVSLNAPASAVRNILALGLTLGGASGGYYYIDTKLIDEILEQQKVMAKVGEYRSLLKAANDAQQEVSREDQALHARAVPAIRVDNRTGFATPTVRPDSIRYSLSRDGSVRAPIEIDLGITDPFARERALIESRRAGLLRDRSYRVVCQEEFSQGSFRGKVRCDPEVAESAGSLAPRVNVTLDAVYEGLQFPDYEGSNQHISVSVENDALTVTNLTKQYVEVRSIAIYGGRDVQENPMELSLAPSASNRDPIRLSKLTDSKIRSLFTFDGVRRQQLERQAKFGVAVKYRVGDGENFRTFYGDKNVVLRDLVSVR